MTDPTLCQPLRLAEPITGGPFRRGGRFSPATWRKFSVQLASLIRYMHPMRDNSCAFTGHRPHKFPWRYDETDNRCVALKSALMEQIAALVETGITDFYSGGADGVDCWASLIVLELRKRNPALRLHMLLPHEGQEDKWSDSAQERYHLILKQADSIEYVSHEYYDGSMLDRNHHLVEVAGVLLVVYNDEQRLR